MRRYTAEEVAAFLAELDRTMARVRDLVERIRAFLGDAGFVLRPVSPADRHNS